MNLSETSETALSMSPMVAWINDAELSAIYSSDYWNDIEEEKKKAWWIVEGGEASHKLQLHLEESGILAEYRTAEEFILKTAPSANLAIADIAAGVGWTSALLSRLDNVSSVSAIDISKHRMEQVFPAVVKMFSGQAEKIQRYIGSFYKLNFADASIDIAFLSQAFHHADKPLHLLMEIDRILKPGGKLILIGEEFIGIRKKLKVMLKTLLLQKKLVTNFYELFPPDEIGGDHYYQLKDYYLFMQLLGYRVIKTSIQGNKTVAVFAEKT